MNKTLLILLIVIPSILALSGIGAALFIPTKVVEYVVEEEIEWQEPYTVKVMQSVTENYTDYEQENFNFKTYVNPYISKAGNGANYLLFDITIYNYEDQEGCWEYHYIVYINDEKYDDGDLTGACVAGNDYHSFSTPLYQVESGEISYSADITATKTPTKNISFSGTRTVLKEKEITKYRDATKLENITKKKKVNWIFGFTVADLPDDYEEVDDSDSNDTNSS